MDVEHIIDEIEQLQEMFEAPDIRPLNANDISAANRRHDEILARSPWFRLLAAFWRLLPTRISGNPARGKRELNREEIGDATGEIVPSRRPAIHRGDTKGQDPDACSRKCRSMTAMIWVASGKGPDLTRCRMLLPFETTNSPSTCTSNWPNVPPIIGGSDETRSRGLPMKSSSPLAKIEPTHVGTTC